MESRKYTASRDRPYLTRRRPWTERELAHRPPGYRLNYLLYVESVEELCLSYGKEGCARVKSKIMLFLGDKLFIIIIISIIMLDYTKKRIFLHDASVKYSSAR